MTTTTAVPVLNGAGGTTQIAAEQGTQGSATVYTFHSVPEVSGLPVNAGNPMPVLVPGSVVVTATASLPVVSAGSTGTAYNSATAASIPISGYSLLLTIPVTAARNYVEVQNQSTDLVQVVRDDGAGNNQVSIMLASASVSGGQGGGWSSSTFKGRIRVYATNATDQVAAYQD